MNKIVAKRISFDFILNITASLVLTGVMQLVVYPFLAWKFSEEKYGIILTTMGLLNVLISVFGTTINNARLLQNSFYEDNNTTGDFNVIVILFSSISAVTSFLGVKFFVGLSIKECILAAIFCFIGTWNAYNCTDFRLKLNFKRILLFNIVGAIGYLIGVVASYKTGEWLFPFVIYQLVSCAFLFLYSGLYKETYRKTFLLSDTVKKIMILMITTLSGSLMTYLDRFLIYPFLGPDSVSTYGVASFFGKGLSIVMTPIAGVLLGYYAQKGFVMNKRRFWYTNLVALGCGGVFIAISYFIAPFVTGLLYPKQIDSATPYILIANLAATIGVVTAMTQSAVLKFAPTWLQIVKELIYGITYFVVGILTIDRYGLWGFCIAAVASAITKLISLYIIGNIFIEKSEING